MPRTLARLWRPTLGALICGLALSGLAGAAPAPAGARARGAQRLPVWPAKSRAIARRDARWMLGQLHLPASATRSRREPAGDGGRLHRPLRSLDPAAAYRWWTLRTPVTRVLALIRSHPPAHSARVGSGVPVHYRWISRADATVRTGLDLWVTVTRLADGRTGVLAVAESPWSAPPPNGSLVPGGVTAVSVSLDGITPPINSREASAPETVVLTNPAAVREAIGLADALQPFAPGHVMCPMIISVERSLTVTYSAGPAGPALATAYVNLAIPGGGGTECDPVELSVRGGRPRPLLGPGFATGILALAGLSLSPPA